jgi:hypothetical protein
MGKVMLAKEEIEALESALEISGGDKANVVQWHSTNIWDGKQAPLNDLDLDTVCTALYVGYEIEVGPEEKIRAYFLESEKLHTKFYKEENPKHLYIKGTIDGIKDTLNLLNIQIKGINC